MVQPLDPRPHPRDPVAELDRTVPVVLLPVRLETRWFAGPRAEELELRVRIFPDAIHLANPAAVHPQERDLVVAYWHERTQVGPATAGVQARWQTLVDTCGDARAAWLRDLLTPTIGPHGAPAFPPVAVSDAPAPPAARALPDRFVACALAGSTREVIVTGHGVPVSVPILPADAGPTWQVDFAAAEALGLAVRLRMPRPVATRLTHIVVVGVRTGGATDGAATLAALLGDHAIDRGLALLPAGTPTNHTTTTPTVGALPGDGLPPGTDGANVATAFGVPVSTLQHVRGAGASTDALAAALQRTTWPATWGYFLEQIVGDAVRPEVRAAGQALYTEAVRADGPFVSLCVGRQPYGILPLAPLARWRDERGAEVPFATALAALRPRWRTAGHRAAQLPAEGDGLPALQAILAHQPHTVRVSTRAASTVDIAVPWWLELPWLPLGEDARARILQRLKQPIIDELTRLGLLPTPDPVSIEPLVHADVAQPVALTLVGAAADGLAAPAYLAGLADATDPVSIRDHRVAGATPRTLLYLLLRHATLLTMTAAVDRSLGTSAAGRRDRDVRSPGDATVWDRLERASAAGGGLAARTRFEHVELDPSFAELRAHRTALRRLATCSAADLDRATAAMLDTTSHRLDAWISALATQRLRAMRQRARAGAHVGGYGVVTAPPVPSPPVTDGATAPSTSLGFVLAPGLDHARTAAVLRAAFDARPTPDLAVDLSSQRVRRARWLLEGLRAGRGLGELLGYQLERAVANGETIRALRRRFPLDAPSDDPNWGRLDGLAAYHAWQVALPPPPLDAPARALLEAVDATADLLLAESVHQHVVGNAERAGALLAAVASGTIAPPEPAVTRTPTDSDGTTSHVVWTFDPRDRGWPGDDQRVRALANPTVNAALAQLLGDPAQLTATVAYTRDGVTQTAPRAIADLELCALDLCALIGATDFARSPLAALFAATAPADAHELRITPSPMLREGLLLARTFATALSTAVPWSPDGAVDVTAREADATAALAQLRAIRASGAALDRQRLAAVVGAPLGDAPADRLADDLLHRASAAAVADRVRLLSGLPAPSPVATIVTSDADMLATRSAQLMWLGDAARLRPTMAAVELLCTARPRPMHVARTAGGDVVVALGPPLAIATSGLRVDAWREARPRGELTAGLAFHHDAPRARAPQAILLAVPPDPTQAWSTGALIDTVLEALDLATLRLAHPPEVWGPLLPALYLADSVDGGTVSLPQTELATNLIVRE